MWRLDKITDQNGNYIEFVYNNDNQHGGESWIEEIKYTGNGSLEPYNTIKFLYDERTDNNKGYIAGEQVLQNVILRSIKVENEGNIVREYQFKYHPDLYSHLNKIIEIGSDRTQFNETIIEWGAKAAEWYTTQSITSGISNLNKSAFYPGDFNGDGRADFLTVNNNNWYVYLNTSGNAYSLNASGTVTDLKKVHVADIDNDGDEDFYLGAISNYTSEVVCPTQEITDCYTAEEGDLTYQFFTFSGSTVSRGSTAYDIVFHFDCKDGEWQNIALLDYIADFDGNGKMDFTYTDPDLAISNIQSTSVTLLTPPSTTNPSILLDFNGDGNN